MSTQIPSNNQEPCLETNGLIVGFAVPLCQVPDLRLNPGKPYRFNAPNGLGKTTFFKTILGLQPPFAGSSNLNSNSTTYLPAQNAFPPVSNVREVLEYWTKIEPTTQAALDEAIDLLGLAALIDQPLSNLSSGQARRLAILRVFASASPALVLDEPFAGIDMSYTKAIVAHLAERAKQHLVLYVAHDRIIPGSEPIDLAPFTEPWSAEL